MTESDSNPQDLVESLRTIAAGLVNLKRLIDESPQVCQLRSDLLQLAQQAQAAVAAVRVDPKVVEFLAACGKNTVHRVRRLLDAEA